MVPRSREGPKEGKQFLHVYIEKNLLKCNIWPISIKLGTNHSCKKGIQVYSNEVPSPLQRGDNHKSAKIGKGYLIFSSPEPLYHKISDLHESFLT
jgi:hypothetical protein